MDDERVMLVLAKIPRHGFGDYLVGGIPTPLEKNSQLGCLFPIYYGKTNQPTSSDMVYFAGLNADALEVLHAMLE